MTQYEDDVITVEETPSQLAKVWVEEGYGPTTFYVGQVVRMTDKNIWVDTAQGQFYFRKGIMRFIKRSNGQYASYSEGDTHWLYFEPDPLVKFISNGM